MHTQNTDSEKIDIIMPVYNVEDFLTTSILSVLNQTHQDFRLIVVDDKSTDRSVEIIKQLMQCDDRIELIELSENTPGGAGIPSNHGINVSTAPFITFLDSDDIYAPSFLESHLKNLNKSGAEVSLSRFKLFENKIDDAKESYAVKRFDTLYASYENRPVTGNQKLAYLNLAPVPWTKVYRRSFFHEKDIRFPEGPFFYEDNPLHWDVCLEADSIALLDERLVYHRTHRVGQTTARNDKNLLYFNPISEMIIEKCENRIHQVYFVQWFHREFKWRYDSCSSSGKKEMLTFAIKTLAKIDDDVFIDAQSYFGISDKDVKFLGNLKKGIQPSSKKKKNLSKVLKALKGKLRS